MVSVGPNICEMFNISENDPRLKKSPIHAWMSNESHFFFDNLRQESCLKFLQYALNCLSFSPSNLFAALFGSAFQLLLIIFRHFSLSFQIESSSMVALVLAIHSFALMSSEQLHVFVVMAPRYLQEFTLAIVSIICICVIYYHQFFFPGIQSIILDQLKLIIMYNDGA